MKKRARRNLFPADGGEAGPSKKSEGQKVARSKNSVNHLEAPSQPAQDVPSTASSSSEVSPPKRKMKSKTCVVCGATQSNKTTPFNHQVVEHFYQEISRKFPQTESDQEANFPCSFPGCSEVSKTGLGRVLHLGKRHGQVELCLAKMETAKTSQKEEQKRKPRSASVGPLKCRKCSEQVASREMLKLHVCNISLLGEPPARARRNYVEYFCDLNSTEKEEKDTSGEVSGTRVDSSEDNNGNLTEVEVEEGDPWRGHTCEVGGECGERDCVECSYCGRSYHKKEHGHFPCDARSCHLCFPTEKLMGLHFRSCHDFEDL